MSQLNEKMTALADAVRKKAELIGLLTIDEMTAAVTNLVVGGTDISDATVTGADLRKGVTAYGANGKVTGTIPTVTPSLSANVVTVPQGYISEEKTITIGKLYDGNYAVTPGVDAVHIGANTYFPNGLRIDGAPALSPENIRYGKSLFGVEGTFTYEEKLIPATSDCIAAGYAAYVNGERVVGNFPSQPTPQVSGNVVTIPVGWNFAEYDLTIGTAKEAETYTPGTSDITIPADTYLAGQLTIKGDANLISENIKAGVTVFNVEGTFTSDADAAAEDIAKDKTAYVNGEKITGTHTCGAKNQILVTNPDGHRLFNLDCPENINSFQSKVAGDQTLMAINNKIYSVFPPDRIEEDAKCTVASPRTDIAAVYNCEWHCMVLTTSGELYKTEPEAWAYKFPKTLEPLGITGISDFCPSNEGRFWYITGTSVNYSNDSQYEKADPVPGVLRFLSNKADHGYANVGYGCFALNTTGEIAAISSAEEYSNRIEVRTVSPPPSDGGSWKDVSFYGYEPWDGGGCYIFATSTNGDLYFAQNNAMQIDVVDSLNFSKLEGISGVKNTPGYCVSGVTWEMDENENEVEVSYESTVALAVDGDGRLWKLSAATSGSSLAGIKKEQVGTDTDWVWCEGKIDRGGKCFAQKGDQIIRLTASSANQITLSQKILRGIEGRLAAVCDIYYGKALLICGK